MKRSKKVFIFIAMVFVVGVLIVSYDISKKTSFPGSKKYLKESIAPSEEKDSAKVKQKNEGTLEKERK